MSENEEKNKIEVEIVSVYTIFSMDPKEFGKKYYVLLARTSTGEIISLKIPEEEYSKEKLQELLKKEIEKLRGLKEEKIVIEL